MDLKNGRKRCGCHLNPGEVKGKREPEGKWPESYACEDISVMLPGCLVGLTCVEEATTARTTAELPRAEAGEKQ